MSTDAGSGSTLHLVGLGPGPAELLTLQAWELLASGRPLRVRDPEHEAAQTVLARGFRFEPVAPGDPAELARQTVDWAIQYETSVYAVPGSPLEAPETVPLLAEAEARGLRVETVPTLCDLDRLPAADPVVLGHGGRQAVEAGMAFSRLVSVMARLRAPGGCPWDREQTHSSLAIHLLEEAHEALDAIDRGDMVDLEEELGDLLLQVVFHSQLAREDGHFEVAEVVEELLEKLVHRHPHIFGDVVVSGAAEVVANWEALKHDQKGRSSPAEDIPNSLPALLYAHKVLRRLSGAGEELDPSPERIAMLARLAGVGGEEVIGDLLYEVVALAQKAGVDPEGALRRRASGRLEARAAGPAPRGGRPWA